MYPDVKKNSLKIICFGYREWSKNIYRSLSDNQKLENHQFILINNKKLVDYDFCNSLKPDMILFYGWSEIIDHEIIENFCCLMLHPSSLPQYRGGSPIQNQIIDGIKESEVCIFKMEKEIDSGQIIKRAKLDLTGDLKEIFKRIELIGTKLSLQFLINGFNPQPQIGNPTYCNRRKPEESEITKEEINECSALYLHNKIRMLNDPYPNAFIKCSDGKKLYITKSYIE